MTKRLLTLAGLAVLVLACAPQMHAAITTELTLAVDATHFVSIDQNGVPILADSSVGGWTDLSSTGSGPHGTIVFIGTVGNFSFNVTTGRGGGVEVLPTLINLNSIDVLSTGSGTLTLTFTDTSYSDLASQLNLSSSATFTGNTPNGSTAAFIGYAGPANAIPATGLIGSTGTYTQASSPAGSSFASTINLPNPTLVGATVSLSERIILGFKGAGEIDSGFTIANVAVPEPASIIFLGTMVLGLAGLIRKGQTKRSS